MAMQTNLSKKDKMTIAVVLFAGLVFVFVWYLIRPNIKSITATSDKIEQAQFTQSQYKNKLINLTSGEDIYNKTVSDFKESTSDFYPLMNSSEIDRMVTSYVLKSGLFSENLIIKMPLGAIEEKPYVYSSLATDRSSESVTSDEISTTATSTPASGSTASSTTKSATVDSLITPYETARSKSKSTASSGVQCANLTLVVTGKQKDCQALIDDLCTKPAVRITSFEWEKSITERVNPETGYKELVDSGKVRLKISVNLYMADITDYETAVSDAVAEAEG